MTVCFCEFHWLSLKSVIKTKLQILFLYNVSFVDKCSFKFYIQNILFFSYVW